MKHLILTLGVMFLTFGLGVGIDRLLWEPKVEPLPNLEIIKLPLEPQREMVPTVAPLPAEPAATPLPHLIRDYDPSKFSVWANFYIMGPKPKAFADFDSIEAALNHGDEEHPGYIRVYLRRSEGEYDDASATFALATERRLFFATSKTVYTEFEYRFDGEFIRKDFNAADGKYLAVLRGTLTKSKDGQKIAEHTFSFRMEYLGC